ncbi:hypothetical protein ANN_12191 [Periplaneta americana]|uniref:Uncharacterized protein n=1 Tax=Periplaneta americana TaxID=6978 RepID=A0ABQ8TFV2_PERAM|nr:hypothetical protein ANN_12191 [Periplaneta americana]
MGDGDKVFGEMGPRVRHRLPDIRRTVVDNFEKNPTRNFTQPLKQLVHSLAKTKHKSFTATQSHYHSHNKAANTIYTSGIRARVCLTCEERKKGFQNPEKHYVAGRRRRSTVPPASGLQEVLAGGEQFPQKRAQHQAHDSRAKISTVRTSTTRCCVDFCNYGSHNRGEGVYRQHYLHSYGVGRQNGPACVMLKSSTSSDLTMRHQTTQQC